MRSKGKEIEEESVEAERRGSFEKGSSVEGEYMCSPRQWEARVELQSRRGASRAGQSGT